MSCFSPSFLYLLPLSPFLVQVSLLYPFGDVILVLTLSISNMNMNMNMVGMVLMVVVVVAVGGVFAHLSAYRGEPRLPLNLWKSL